MLIVAIAIIIPDFGPVLSLLGGTLDAALCVVFPIWFYLALGGEVRLVTKIFLGLIVALAVTGGLGNSYVEVKNIVKVIEGKYKRKY